MKNTKINEKLFRYITSAEEIEAEKYDGTYILLPKVVEAFKSVDSKDLNVCDLDAIYLSVIGTWKVSYKVKKQRIEASNLSDHKKRELYKLINDLQQRANTEFHRNGSMGMFGTGFMSFSKSFKDETSLAELRRFIAMLIRVNDTNDETELFKIVATESERHINGIGVGTMSILLHCLRPCVFPVLNGRMGMGSSVYTEVGIELINPGLVETYMENLKAIKEFRDKNCKFKNYRVIDLVPEELIEKEEEAEKEAITESPQGATYKSNRSYSDNDFLNDVFMSKEKYDNVLNTLSNKKNIILQGAPGVGKTFAAKRLAYSIMGDKDDDRIEFVQFHQNYSYEDFIMGYKPTENGGFKLTEGVFYRFCKKAAEHGYKEYFFIIDEINRGNMSKIFGELLMLIENDYRGEAHAIRLAYQKESDPKFYVPENLYIIGMMNTADRSLAMIDYALRRRFGFCEMRPAFDTDKFKAYCKKASLVGKKFNDLIDTIKELNKAIALDPSLGRGFQIGHSYFCLGNSENKNENEDNLDSRLAAIVEYDIIPTIKEYWFDNETMSEEWQKKLNNAIGESVTDEVNVSEASGATNDR